MKKTILLGIVMIWATFKMSGQSEHLLIEQKLSNTGFENIRVKNSGKNYFISFESNIYRWNVRALSTALDTVAEYIPGDATINLIQLSYDIPQIETRINARSWLNFRTDTAENNSIDTALSISYRTKNSWSKIKKSKPIRRNSARFDLVFYPQFYLVNLRLDQIYEIQFNIAPALEVSFWKGMLLTAQVIFPIYNDCQTYGKGGNMIRPGFLLITQNFRLPGPVFGKVSIGNFNYDRYGIDFKLKYPFKNPRWNIGMNMGYTGYSVFDENGLDLGDLDTFTFSGVLGYFLPRFNLRFDLSGGRYIRGDYGGRFDMSRMFGETTIGFYAGYTTINFDESGEPTFGFHFAIPFPPGKRLKRKRFRVDLPNYFDWEYNGTAEFVYGRYYEVRPDANRTEHYFNPLYIKNELLNNRHYR